MKSCDAMRDFCQEHPESSFNNGFAFGFRADTAQYSYLIRLNPCKGEENLSIYCYRRDWLDSHMKNRLKRAYASSPRTIRKSSGSPTATRCGSGGLMGKRLTGYADISTTATLKSAVNSTISASLPKSWSGTVTPLSPSETRSRIYATARCPKNGPS